MPDIRNRRGIRRTYIPLNKVLTNVFNGCDAVVAVVKDGLAICKSEYEKGESGKYILKK